MRHFRATAMALGLTILMALPASAQQRGGGMMGGASALLSNKGVQKELKLDESQISKVNVLADDLRTKQREAMQGFQDLSPEERRAKGAEVNQKMNAEVDKALVEIFKPEQTKRFRQIRLQVGGADAFTNPTVASEIKLNDDQKGKIKDILSSQQSKMQEIFQTAQDDREGAMKKMTELRKSTKDQVVAILEADQKKTWDGLVGEAFEYVPTPPPGR